MAGMKRFVTYIYAYEDKKKGNNIGFAKIEIRGEDCRVEIHLRGVYTRQSVCSVYLFRENVGEIEGVFVGDMRLANGNGDFGGIVKAGHVGGSPFGIGDMEGIFLLTEDDRIFMSRWKEGNPLVVCRETFHVWQAKQQVTAAERAKPEETVQDEPDVNREGKTQSEPKEIPKERPQNEPTGMPEERLQNEPTGMPEETSQDIANGGTARKPEDISDEIPTEIQQTAAGEPSDRNEQDVQATEIPMRNIFPDYDWQGVWESLILSHRLYHPFEDPAAECIQIELKNLRELPKRYWYLGNNSFLLHGFFNYHYLVVGRTGEDRWFIGVPGIYQRQERVMAAIFGFPEFLTVAQEGKKNEESGEPVNRFGCWCRYVEE